jgi:hypothetical protein
MMLLTYDRVRNPYEHQKYNYIERGVKGRWEKEKKEGKEG